MEPTVEALLKIMEFAQTADGSLESAEDALINIRGLAQETLLNLKVIAFDSSMEKAWCPVCARDLKDDDVCPGCKRSVIAVE